MALQVGAASASAASSSTTRNTDLGQKDIFLKLLVAQMKNQDPLKPQDATQMSSQLAQFNMVEQQTNTNSWLEQMAGNGGLGSAGASGALDSASAGYLGRTVTINQNTVEYMGASSTFSTDLGLDAASAQVVIRDSSGQAVRTVDLGPLQAGVQSITWDGSNDAGSQVAFGSYAMEINALDYQGQPIAAAVQRSGLVDSVRLATSGEVQLMVAGTAASLTDITEVRL